MGYADKKQYVSFPLFSRPMRHNTNHVVRHVLSGHTGTVSSLLCQEADPQVITGSLDSHCRLWDLAAGKTMSVLTHHKKGIRALASHPSEFTFATGSTSSIKQWKCPEGAFMQNFEGHNAIINTLSVNNDNIMFSGGDNGSMGFWVQFRFNSETVYIYYLLTQRNRIGRRATDTRPWTRLRNLAHWMRKMGYFVLRLISLGCG